MRSIAFFPIAISAFALFGFSTRLETKRVSNDNAGFAVLELFTSQGCSSCPPADAVLGEYATSKNVIALSFHVDYWNRLGWKDPYSSPKFSERQRAYSESLNSSVYTPQLVVNGANALVGSESENVKKLVDQALQQTHKSSVEISASRSENDIIVHCKCDNRGNGNHVNIALVKKKETTNIRRGENSGRILTNYNVVFDFSQTPLTADDSEATFAFDKNKVSADYFIVAYVQNGTAGEIVAAAKSEIK